MPRQTATRLLLCCTVVAALSAAAQAQDKDVYRYTDADGHVVYSDKPPPPSAKNAQTKRLGGNFIETDQVSLAQQQATDRYPVTLYTFPCGDVCDNAAGMLNRRGVPFSTVDVQSPDGAKKLQALTGELSAPVLSVGDKLVGKGFNEARWQAMLDEAGYPKTAAPRTTQVGRAPVAAAPSTETQSATVKPGGYPATK